MVGLFICYFSFFIKRRRNKEVKKVYALVALFCTLIGEHLIRSDYKLRSALHIPNISQIIQILGTWQHLYPHLFFIICMSHSRIDSGNLTIYFRRIASNYPPTK